MKSFEKDVQEFPFSAKLNQFSIKNLEIPEHPYNKEKAQLIHIRAFKFEQKHFLAKQPENSRKQHENFLFTKSANNVIFIHLTEH